MHLPGRVGANTVCVVLECFRCRYRTEGWEVCQSLGQSDGAINLDRHGCSRPAAYNVHDSQAPTVGTHVGYASASPWVFPLIS